MKKLVFIISLALSQLAAAQDLFVYNVTGSAERLENGSWQALTKRAALKQGDQVRVGKNSALSVLDKQNSKVYAIKESAAAPIQNLIAMVSDNEKALSTKFATHAAKALFDGSSSTVSHSAAGCTYRSTSIENDIARTILYKEQNTSLVQLSNMTTDYGVSFELVDRQSGEVLGQQVAIDHEAFFRIKNNSATDLYVNILDVNPKGELYDCLPADEGMTLSHLLIPANSVIDLADYPVAFTAPQGTDHLILVAYEEPFDLREVNKVILSRGVTPLNSTLVGVYNMPVKIW